MKRLRFPVIKGPMPEPRTLSMDDYLKFVLFNLRHTVDKEAVDKWKKTLAVDVPFSMKE